MNSNSDVMRSIEHMGKLFTEGWKIHDNFMYRYSEDGIEIVNYMTDEFIEIDTKNSDVRIKKMFEN